MLRGFRKLIQSDPAVVERWARLRSLRIARRMGHRIARPRIWLNERRRVRQLESTFDTIRRQSEKLEQAQFPASKVFMNIALFILNVFTTVSTSHRRIAPHSDIRFALPHVMRVITRLHP